MRVVLDTNILARAAASRNEPAGNLFERICDGHILVVSHELLEELSCVLGHDRVRLMHGLSDVEIEQFVASIESGGTLVSLPNTIPEVVPHDPDDDAIVATPITGQAEVLCARTCHLFHESVIAYARQLGVEIMDDIELLNRIRAPKTTDK